MFSPLKITAHLQCAVVTDETLPIDGVLYYYAMRQEYGVQDVTIPGGHPDKQPIHASVPLLMLNKGPQWFYAASFAQWSQPVAEMTDHWNKRYDVKYDDLVDFGVKRGKVIVEQGRYRAYHMPVFCRHSLSVSWYVMGGGEAIRTLLAYVTHLGKKTAQGWGAVLRWEVEPWRADWSVRGSGGELMRAIPASASKDGPARLLYCGYRPSYWDKQNQAMCVVP